MLGLLFPNLFLFFFTCEIEKKNVIFGFDQNSEEIFGFDQNSKVIFGFTRNIEVP